FSRVGAGYDSAGRRDTRLVRSYRGSGTAGSKKQAGADAGRSEITGCRHRRSTARSSRAERVEAPCFTARASVAFVLYQQGFLQKVRDDIVQTQGHAERCVTLS